MMDAIDPHCYVLKGKKPIPASLTDMALFMAEQSNVAVRQATIGDAWISTVFLGYAAICDASGAPLIFETMIFGGAMDKYQRRYTTYDFALSGHIALTTVLIKAQHAIDNAKQKALQG